MTTPAQDPAAADRMTPAERRRHNRAMVSAGAFGVEYKAKPDDGRVPPLLVTIQEKEQPVTAAMKAKWKMKGHGVGLWGDVGRAVILPAKEDLSRHRRHEISELEGNHLSDAQEATHALMQANQSSYARVRHTIPHHGGARYVPHSHPYHALSKLVYVLHQPGDDVGFYGRKARVLRNGENRPQRRRTEDIILDGAPTSFLDEAYGHDNPGFTIQKLGATGRPVGRPRARRTQGKALVELFQAIMGEAHPHPADDGTTTWVEREVARRAGLTYDVVRHSPEIVALLKSLKADTDLVMLWMLDDYGWPMKDVSRLARCDRSVVSRRVARARAKGVQIWKKLPIEGEVGREHPPLPRPTQAPQAPADQRIG
jgi:hypothetical protein